MTITFQPDNERLIAEAMESGAYPDVHAVIRRALEVLRSEDRWLDENKTAIAEKIDRAFDQFEHGQYFSPGQSRAEMDKRKAEWLREHRR
jgi:Arc/MetJ-type ribon-helix-helix transcriptional regulator